MDYASHAKQQKSVEKNLNWGWPSRQTVWQL